MVFTSNPYKEEKKLDLKTWRWPSTADDCDTLFQKGCSDDGTPKEDCFSWLGHACCFFRLNGVNFLTDPVLRDLPLIPRLVPLPFDKNLIKNIDYILISHGHRDHLDIPSMQIVLKNNPECRVLMPLELGQYINSAKHKEEIQEAGWWQQFDFSSLPTWSRSKNCEHPKVTFLPALHWHMRMPWDAGISLWGSYWIESVDPKTGVKKSVYFAGDTRWGDHFKDIQNVMGSPTVALMPIGPFAPEDMMKSGHVNPAESVKACNDLGAEYMVPIHHSTYSLGQEPLSMDIKLVRTLVDSGNLTGQLRQPVIGQKYTFDRLSEKDVWSNVYEGPM